MLNFVKVLHDAIQTHYDNNEILEEDMVYLSDPSRAPRTIDELLRQLSAAKKHAEADRTNLDYCQHELWGYRTREQDLLRKERQLTHLMTHFTELRERIEAITVPLRALAEQNCCDPEMAALVKGINNYLDGSNS